MYIFDIQTFFLFLGIWENQIKCKNFHSYLELTIFTVQKYSCFCRKSSKNGKNLRKLKKSCNNENKTWKIVQQWEKNMKNRATMRKKHEYFYTLLKTGFEICRSYKKAGTCEYVSVWFDPLTKQHVQIILQLDTALNRYF